MANASKGIELLQQVWLPIPWLISLLRMGCSYNFLYVCSATINTENVSFDAMLYAAALLPALPYEGFGAKKANEASTWNGVWDTLMLVALLFNIAALALLVMVRYKHIGSLKSCDKCPHESIPSELSAQSCGLTGEDFFYNAQNYCPTPLAAACGGNVPSPTPGIFITSDPPHLAHCALRGCSIKFLPLQTVLYWLMVGTLALNTIGCLALLVMRSYLKSEEQTPTLLAGTDLQNADSGKRADNSAGTEDGNGSANGNNSAVSSARTVNDDSDNANNNLASAPLLHQQGYGFVAPQKLPRLKLVATRPVASQKLRLRANSRHNAAAFNNV